jgi:hypothetical protein
MNEQSRLGGVSALVSGALFLVKAALELVVGDPPSDGGQLLAWRTDHHAALSATNEVLFFAALLLVPTVLALYRSTAVWH